MEDQTAYNVLITYQVGEGYDAAELKQLQLTLADYSEAGVRMQIARILDLNPAITRYLINITT